MAKLVYFNVCATVALLALIIALIVRKQTKGRTNSLFMALAISLILSAVLDIYNVMHNNGFSVNTEYNVSMRYITSYLYFLIRNFTAPLYVLYICSYLGIFYKVSRASAFHFLWAIPYLIDFLVLVTNPFHHLTFSIARDGDFAYSRGPLLYVLYAVVAYYLFMCVFVLIKYKALIPFRKALFLFMFLPINGLSVVIQMINPALRIEIFVSTLLALALAVEVQRPEEMVDYVVGTASFNAFLTELRKRFDAASPVTLLAVKFTNHATLRSTIGLEQYGMLLRNISAKMYQMSRIMNTYSEVFYLDSGSFCLMGNSERYENMRDLGRILAAYMQEPMRLRQMEVLLDARLCILQCPDDISDLTGVLNFLNTYQNKLPDENRLISLSSIASTREFKMRNDMEAIIYRGISNYNFKMYYQPIYSVKEKKFVSAEALIRLEDEKYGFVSPALFIPAAEENGAIHEIGDFVLEDVFRFIGENDFDSLGLEYIEVNLSVAQCIENNLSSKILKIMDKHGVRPDQVNLEITETSADYDPGTTDKNIRNLAQNGLSFSLDDYGTGYSNIQRVVSLPLSIVKLDKSLVDDMDSTMMWTVISNTVSMLKRLDKKILVEGVEDKRSLDRFVELGVDYIQGYYFSKPLRETDFLKFILKENFGLNV